MGRTPGPLSIPVYTDAFPLLASVLVERGAYFTLVAEVRAAQAGELVATAPAHASFAFELPADAAAPRGADLRWHEPDPVVWIPTPDPRGGMMDDGVVYAVVWADDRLVVETVIDHAPVAVIEAWLAERAGVPVAYCRR